MEDGENGAKCLWNGYIREKSMIFCGNLRARSRFGDFSRWSSKHFQLPNIGLVTHDGLWKISI